MNRVRFLEFHEYLEFRGKRRFESEIKKYPTNDVSAKIFWCLATLAISSGFACDKTDRIVVWWRPIK